MAKKWTTWAAGAAVALVLAAGAAAQWLMNLCNNRIAYSVIRDLRREA
mgnify:CR=1 FL=1